MVNKTGQKSSGNKSSKIMEKVSSLILLFLYAVYSYTKLIFRFFVPPQMKSLNGEIFLITGSSTGIGREVVLNLAKNHPTTTLVLWDFNATLNNETAAKAKSFGAKVHAYTVDVTDKAKVKATAEKVRKEVGDPSMVLNNAGVALGGQFFSCPEEDLEKTIQVNLISHFYTLRAFLPQMIKNNHGHIITTASLGSFFGHKSCIPYYASKFAIRGYIESLQDELYYMPENTDKIHFTTIFPAFTETPMTSKSKTSVGLGDKGYLKAEFVAEKIVEGIRQNQENVFIPHRLEALVLLKRITPSQLFWKIRRFVVSNDRKVD